MLNKGYVVAQHNSVSELLKQKLRLCDIDELAKLLAKVVREEVTLEQALATFSVSARQQVKSWFDDHPDLSQRILMITLAVLNGSSYQSVNEASQQLQFLIEPPSEKEEASDYKKDKFNSKRSQRLKEVRAHLVNGYENTEGGLSSVELIELDNPAFRPAILEYVWDEYDQCRDSILSWLYQLGSHPKSEVRLRAAEVVGMLSTYTFRQVLQKVLQPWANSQEPRLQRLAALALTIPAINDNLQQQVQKLLYSWSKKENNLNLRWTATVAYGSYFGMLFPDAALRGLFAIAQSGDGQLLSAVADSVASLFDAGCHFTVLNAIKAWTEQANTEVANQFGLLIFWGLMHEAKVATDSNKDNWPTLLWLVWEEKKLVKENPKTDQVYEDLVTCLLQRALNLKVTRKLVLQEIRKWLQLVDDDPEHKLYETVGSIIFTLAAQGTGRERERITYNLEQWKSVEQPNAANKILSKIKKYLNI